MKKLAITLFLALICSVGFGQSKQIDNFSKQLSVARDDKSRVMLLSEIGYYTRLINLDTAMLISSRALELARSINYLQGEANALSSVGAAYRMGGDMQNSMFYQFESLRLSQKYNFKNEMAKAYLGIGVIHSDLKDFDLAIKYMKMAYQIYKPLGNKENFTTVLANIGETYNKANKLDSALYYLQLTHDYFLKTDENAILPFVLSRLGHVNVKLKNYDAAFGYAIKTIQLAKNGKGVRVQCIGNRVLSECYKSYNKFDSAVYYAKQSFDLAKANNYRLDFLESSNLLQELYENKNLKEAYYYAKLSKSLNDSMYGAEKVTALQKKIIDEQEQVRENQAKVLADQNRMKQTALFIGLFIAGIIGFILYRNNRQKQKANALLQEQKEKVESTLSKLKATQTQLIQSEKLASLGELTAGIAHEIQNPLNFVNNFSEMSVELAKELDEEIDKEVIDKGLVKELVSDLSQNQQKINHHGKRASSIVSGMLEHSKASTGERTLTDINKLADEYLRLSYHGIRAKDSNFNSDYKTAFDENLPKIAVIPQDMGRVLLNLINNAFWAVKTTAKPLVIVKTEQSNNQLIIKVTDNGTGMTEEVKAKIFQPFFTTKPTGQGTGLGLSLAYDIVTKGHGGTIEVESVETEGTTFIVRLPIH